MICAVIRLRRKSGISIRSTIEDLLDPLKVYVPSLDSVIAQEGIVRGTKSCHGAAVGRRTDRQAKTEEEFAVGVAADCGEAISYGA